MRGAEGKCESHRIAVCGSLLANILQGGCVLRLNDSTARSVLYGTLAATVSRTVRCPEMKYEINFIKLI